MTGMRHLTDPAMFERFHNALTSEREGYTPWYFLLSKGLKDPAAGIRWKQLEGRLTFKAALKKMREGNNIAIAATHMDPLCIVDVDDIETTPDEIVKPTLSARSRKRIGMHYFYFTDDPRCKENLPTDDKGEIRAGFEYVVAPGSFVLCNDATKSAMPESQKEFAGRYTVENDRAPNTIVFGELPPVFLDQAKKNRMAQEDARKRRETNLARKNTKTSYADKNRSAMWDISISDVMSIPNKTRFKSIFHESETGKNTAVNDDGGLTCWRHLVIHTPLSTLAVLAGVADCNSAGQGFNNGKPSCIDYTDGKTLFAMWKFAKHEGMIPADDPVPSEAVRWYAVHNDLCETSDITDGWKLPSGVYNHTLALIEGKEKISSGRKIISVNKDTNLPSPDMFLIGERNMFDPNEFAKWMIGDSGNTFATMDDTKEVLWYDGGVYRDGGDIVVDVLIERVMDGFKITNNAVKEVIGHIQRRTYVKRDAFDGDPNIINLGNGLYNIETGSLLPHTPTHLSLHKSPIVYDPAAKCTRIDQFFKEVLRENHIPFMYELFGYALLKEKNMDTAVLFEGTGANGKSRMIQLLDVFVGDDVTTHVTPSELSGDNRFALADMFGKLLNTVDDLGNTPLKNLGVFKSVISGAVQRGEHKYQPAFKFKPEVLCVFGCNEVPVTTDTSDGFFRRMVMVPFEQRFEGADADKDLFMKLTTQTELSGLFNCAMVHVQEMKSSGDFTSAGTIEDRKQAYMYASNPVAKFVDEQCSLNDLDGWVCKSELYQQYVLWSRDHGLRVGTKKTMTMYLEERGVVGRLQERDNGTHCRAYVGIELNRTF